MIGMGYGWKTILFAISCIFSHNLVQSSLHFLFLSSPILIFDCSDWIFFLSIFYWLNIEISATAYSLHIPWHPLSKDYFKVFQALIQLLHAFFLLLSLNSRQRGQIGKGVVFTMTLIEWSGFNPHPSHTVGSLDKTLYDDYLCLVASNKQQI